jgi:hypothetical protein
MSAIAERVAAGAAILDEHDPGWWRPDVERAIDLDRLKLHLGDSCVLGQRCPISVLAAFHGVTVANEDEPDELASGDWVQAYQAYAIQLSGLRGYEDLGDWGYAHGFVGAGSAWGALTDKWKRVITERRAAS